jgi:hypothetical protein
LDFDKAAIKKQWILLSHCLYNEFIRLHVGFLRLRRINPTEDRQWLAIENRTHQIR